MKDKDEAAGILSGAQSQTQQTFGFKWKQRDTYESENIQTEARRWLLERYFRGSEAELDRMFPAGVTVLDAGCGAGYSALAMLGDLLERVNYVGADISEAAFVAHDRFTETNRKGAFVQADLLNLPFAPDTFDVVFSEGVLHHTDSTRAALEAVTRLVAPGGHMLFYVYRRKGPVREFTDDYIREELKSLTDEAAWEALRPLTRLGKTLGDLDIKIEIPEDIDVLGIPKGTHDLQRLFYWHVCKAFYRPDFTEDEMLHINFDWFRPTNAHRQSPEEVRGWCDELGLEIEHTDIQESGITIVARKKA